MKIIKQKHKIDLSVNNAPKDYITIWGGDIHGDTQIVSIERESLGKLIKVLQQIEIKGTKLKFKNKLFGC